MERSKFRALWFRYKFALVLFLFASVVIAGNFDNLGFNGNTISSRNTNGNIILSPNGSGEVVCNYCSTNTVPYLDSSKGLQSSSTTTTELGYLHGVTSSIQTQINNAIPFTTLGDTLYESATPAPARLAGNTSATTKFLSQTGNGSISAAPSWLQPSCSNLSNAAASCSTDTTNASNISSGTLGAARLPNPTASTLGGVESIASVSHNFLTSISTSGVPAQAQPAFSDISGTVAATQLPNPTPTTLGGIESLASVSHKWINTISTSGVPSATQPACGDLSDAAASCNTDATNANNISSGTLAVARGGTGQSSYTDGQLLIGNTATGFLSKSTLTAGSNITITNGNGSISIAASSAGSIQFNYTSQTSNYSAAVNDYIVASSTSFTITLPTAVSQSGKLIGIQHNGTSLTNVYTLNTTSAQTIGGVASGSYALYTNGETLLLVSDGANWQIVDHKTATTWNSVSGGIIQFYTFTVAAGSYSGTAGATYTNNGNTYVLATTFTTAATSIVMAGTAAPQASGTLTNSSGTHVGNPVYSAFSGGASLITATTTQPAFWTSPTTNSLQWMRQGNLAIINYNYNQGSAGTVAGSGDYLFGIVPNMTIDTSKTISTYTGSIGTNLLTIASAQTAMMPTIGNIANSSGAAMNNSIAFLYSSTQFRLANFSWAGAVSGGNVSSSYFPSTNNPLAFNITITVPISGWQP